MGVNGDDSGDKSVSSFISCDIGDGATDAGTSVVGGSCDEDDGEGCCCSSCTFGNEEG